MSATCTTFNLQQLTAETAAALEASVAAGQPVTTRLITTCVAEALRDEQLLADLLGRAMRGENALAGLARQVIADEADHIAHTTIAAARRAA